MREAFEGAREPALRRAPRRTCIRRSTARSQRAGIERLYAHQAQALESAWEGTTIVTTGTASGKSLCFQLPTLETLLARSARPRAATSTRRRRSPRTRRARCTRFGLHKQLRPAIYDGDTPREERAAIRRRSNLILTNPDMLHVGVLPHHARVGRPASRTSRSSSSTRRTSTAAFSARTSPTSCGACGGSPAPTERRRASCSRARRSRTRSSSPSA